MNPDSRSDEQLDQLLDRTTGQIRQDRPDTEFERAAVERVWLRLQQQAIAAAPVAESSHRIDSCAGFQAMLPDHRAGKLAQDRLLLLQDHLGECVPCRRALKQLKPESRSTAAAAGSVRRSGGVASRLGWRLAAAAALFIALIGFSVKTDVFTIESGGLIRIEAVDGELFRVNESRAVPLRAGEMVTLERGESLRTAKGSSALLAMADLSQIEMRERSQIAVKERDNLIPGIKSDGLVQLERGSVMIEASHQGSGHLYVDTQDFNVAVTGTVFAVSRGMTGSRVSVVEGQVEVRQRGQLEVLAPGDQTNTGSSLDRVPVEEDIAWSRNSEQYVALLAELRALGKELDRALVPGLRYSSDLLDFAPADTAIVVAIPNISEELSQAHEILKQRIGTSELLRKWWDEEFVGGRGEEQLQEIIERIRIFGDQLGEEILMTVQFDGAREETGPLFLARVSDPQSFMQTLSAQIAELEERSGEKLELTILDRLPSPAAPLPPSKGIYVWSYDGVVALAPQIQQLWKLDAAMRGYDGASLVGTVFHDRLSALYDDGVEWAVGIDVERLIHLDENEQTNENLARVGLDTVQHIIAERKQRDGHTEQSAELTFAQSRQRMAAWLAEPAPLGALDFVGPDANLVAGFVMKDMSIIVEELFEILGANGAEFENSLAEFEREEGVDIRHDFANPLGGELLVALDGPVLPVPSWKVVAEVYDAAQLQHSIEWLVDRINRELTEAGEAPSLELETEQLRGRTYYRVGSTRFAVSVHYVFDSGYMIAGPSRGLLDQTLQNRDAGIRLTDSSTFLDLMPRSGNVHFSGLLYQNVAPILGPLAGTLETLGNNNGATAQIMSNLASGTEPGLALFYGHDDSIAMSAITEGGVFGSALNQLSGATGLLGMQQSLAKSLGQAGR